MFRVYIKVYDYCIQEMQGKISSISSSKFQTLLDPDKVKEFFRKFEASAY